MWYYTWECIFMPLLFVFLVQTSFLSCGFFCEVKKKCKVVEWSVKFIPNWFLYCELALLYITKSYLEHLCLNSRYHQEGLWRQTGESTPPNTLGILSSLKSNKEAPSPSSILLLLFSTSHQQQLKFIAKVTSPISRQSFGNVASYSFNRRTKYPDI